ncbi:MAG TPA: SOUL heme-binding protein, partial [Prolixibacteraceae bacterium]|nr:SOUL heme-binding protein [Prolixibacteraceae bacterium]
EKLQDILRKKGFKTIGNPRFLGYNPPFQLVGRRNEVIIPIEYK